MSYNAENVYISPNVLPPRTKKANKKVKLTKTNVTAGMILTAGIMAANPGSVAFAKEQAVVLVKEPSKVIPNVKTEVLSEVVKSSVIETVAPSVQENIVKSNPEVVKKIEKDVQVAKEKDKKAEPVSKKVEQLVASAKVTDTKAEATKKENANPKQEEQKQAPQQEQPAAVQKVEEKKEEAPKLEEFSDTEKIVNEAKRMYEANGINSQNRLRYSMPKRDLEGFGDCSKFTKDVFKKALGMDIGYNTIEQITNGKENFHPTNDSSELKAGDIMYFNSPGGHELSRTINGQKISVDHTGIYIGDNTFIDMSAGADGISVKKFGSGERHERYVKQSLIGYNRLASSEKKVVTPQTEEQKEQTLVFDPVKEFGSAFDIGGKTLLGTLTGKEAKTIENSMIRPIPRDTYGDISSKYEPRHIGPKEDFHHGIDYPAPIGTPVYAAADGKVIYSGKAGGYGNWIVLEHNINGMKIYTIYGHMKADDLFVKEGDTVKQGQKITAVHSQGQSSGPHLHFSVAKSRDAQAPRIFYDYISPSYTVDANRSDSYTYEGHEAKKQEEKQENKGVVDKQKYWKQALEASKQTGWSPLLIMSQWEIETTHFTSANFRNNNNLAGQTWYPGSPYPKGTPRPKAEGGYYIKYPSAVEGYVDFIKRNPRYSHVKELTTPEDQAREVAAQGWAAGNEYAQQLITLIKQNRAKYGDVGIQKPDEEKAEETKPETPKTEQPAETTETPKAEQPVEKKEEPKQEEKKEEVKKEDKKEETKKENSESKKEDTDAKKTDKKDDKKEEKKEEKKETTEKETDTKQQEKEEKKEKSSSKEEDKPSKEEKEKQVEVEKQEKDTIPFIFEQFFK